MAIQNLPVFFDFIYTNKDGSLTPNAQLYNDIQYQFLSQNFNVGLQVPNQTSAQITAYGNDETIPLGTLWFNSDTGELQYKFAANTIKTITAT